MAVSCVIRQTEVPLTETLEETVSSPHVIPAWRRSKRCESAQCIEVARIEGLVAIRDSKDPHGVVLTFTLAEWGAFVDGVRDGDFDID